MYVCMYVLTPLQTSSYQPLTLHCSLLVSPIVSDPAAKAREHGKLVLLQRAQEAGDLLLLLLPLHVLGLQRGQHLISSTTENVTRLGGREGGREGGKEGGKERQ